MENLDHVRRVLITEPRGYPCQNLNIIVPPTDPDVAAAGGFHFLQIINSVAITHHRGVPIDKQNLIYPMCFIMK